MITKTDLETLRWLLARVLCERRPQLNEEQRERVLHASRAVAAEIVKREAKPCELSAR